MYRFSINENCDFRCIVDACDSTQDQSRTCKIAHAGMQNSPRWIEGTTAHTLLSSDLEKTILQPSIVKPLV